MTKENIEPLGIYCIEDLFKLLFPAEKKVIYITQDIPILFVYLIYALVSTHFMIVYAYPEHKCPFYGKKMKLRDKKRVNFNKKFPVYKQRYDCSCSKSSKSILCAK